MVLVKMFSNIFLLHHHATHTAIRRVVGQDCLEVDGEDPGTTELFLAVTTLVMLSNGLVTQLTLELPGTWW